MSADWTPIAALLRDRLDAGEVRRLVTRLVGLRLLDGSAGGPPWRRIVADGREAVEAARQAVGAELWSRPLPALTSERWRALLQAVDAVDLGSEDALGDAFTGMIGALARSEGKRGGQYFTPPSLVALLLHLVPVQHASVYDPCCGSGGLLVAAGAAGASSLTGQELNRESRTLARWNARVHGLELELGPRAADTLRTDLHAGARFDVVLANPPFNLKHWADAATLDDPRFALDPPRRQANFAWLLHIRAHLSATSLAAVILPLGTLSGRDRREQAIRSALLDEGRIHAILALPDQLFHNTVIGACVWVLGPPTERVLFLDLREHGTLVDRRTRILEEDVLERVSEAIQRARAGDVLDEPGFARTVERQELDEDLRPGRWVRPPRMESDLAPGAVEAAAKRVARLLAASREGDDALRKALDRLLEERDG